MQVKRLPIPRGLWFVGVLSIMNFLSRQTLVSICRMILIHKHRNIDQWSRLFQFCKTKSVRTGGDLKGMNACPTWRRHVRLWNIPLTRQVALLSPASQNGNENCNNVYYYAWQCYYNTRAFRRNPPSRASSAHFENAWWLGLCPTVTG